MCDWFVVTVAGRTDELRKNTGVLGQSAAERGQRPATVVVEVVVVAAATCQAKELPW